MCLPTRFSLADLCPIRIRGGVEPKADADLRSVLLQQDNSPPLIGGHGGDQAAQNRLKASPRSPFGRCLAVGAASTTLCFPISVDQFRSAPLAARQ